MNPTARIIDRKLRKLETEAYISSNLFDKHRHNHLLWQAPSLVGSFKKAVGHQVSTLDEAFSMYR